MQPASTITFLFTDIVGSTQLWEKYPEEMKTALARHDAILREAIETNQGQIIKTTGDGVHAGFSASIDAVKAMLKAREQLANLQGNLPFKVRMGVHSGEAEQRGGDYYGPAINRAARLMSVAHGGQALVSNATAELVRDQLPAGVTLHDLGEHHLKDLARPEHIFQLVQTGLSSEFPPIKTPDSLPNNLPTQLTSFIGRDQEIEDIRARLSQGRLVTLTGSGGTGKSRLAVEVGTEELINFMHGVWLIELAPLTEPDQIVPAIAQVFGLQELPFAPLSNLVIDYLREKKILLLLDNCEHLIGTCARLADDLLHQCRGLKILTSSREALGISGEITYRVPSLAEIESTRLFVERALAANPKFNLNEANSAAIQKICTRLDGIPLAIELAAARVRLLATEQIAERLDDRFRLLVGGSRTALPRQQTLRALIDWSYDLLTQNEKNLFVTASVFTGGWTLEALEEVSGDATTFEQLDQLVNKSLVATEEREGRMRYFMLETVRQYAREKLFSENLAAQTRDRHFAYYDELFEKISDSIRSLTYSALIRNTLEDEIENLRAAIEWGMANNVEAALRLTTNFCFISNWSGFVTEGRESIRIVLDKVENLPEQEGEAAITRQKLIARAKFALGMSEMGQGDNLRAARTFQEAARIARLCGEKRTLGYSLEMYFISRQMTNSPDGEDEALEGKTILTELGDQFGLFMVNLNMARIATHKGNFEERNKYLTRNRDFIKGTPTSQQYAMFLMGNGMTERFRGNFQAARQSFDESWKTFKQLRNIHFENVVHSELGHIARLSGDLTQARQIYEQTILLWRDLGNRSAIANQLECFAFLAIAGDKPAHAAKLLGAAEVLRENIGSPMAKYEETEYSTNVSILRSKLPENEFDLCWSEGRAMSMEHAIQIALS